MNDNASTVDIEPIMLNRIDYRDATKLCYALLGIGHEPGEGSVEECQKIKNYIKENGHVLTYILVEILSPRENATTIGQTAQPITITDPPKGLNP